MIPALLILILILVKPDHMLRYSSILVDIHGFLVFSYMFVDFHGFSQIFVDFHGPF